MFVQLDQFPRDRGPRYTFSLYIPKDPFVCPSRKGLHLESYSWGWDWKPKKKSYSIGMGMDSVWVGSPAGSDCGLEVG